MENPTENFWRLRLEALKGKLEKNNFAVDVVDRLEEARELVLEKILSARKPKSVSWGGSMTFVASGLYELLRTRKDLEVIDTFEKGVPFEEMLERRRRALLVDLFFTGTNAVTEQGHLVNLDMYGNRVAALTFGPRAVVLLIGRNKIVPDLESAFHRVKEYAAPINAMRLDKKTPCVKTGVCQDCASPERICNHWTVTAKCFPTGRIHIVLINRDCGI